MIKRISRALGYELTPIRKHKVLWSQMAHSIGFHGVDCVLDVGANVGQYRDLLRTFGYGGEILSFEPIPRLNAQISERSRKDPKWKVLAPCALGTETGVADFFVSNETDMSSLLAQDKILEKISPVSHVKEKIQVQVKRLDEMPEIVGHPSQNFFLKMDVQGFEPQVLAGAAKLMPRVRGLQIEMAMVPVYEGEKTWKEMVQMVETLGFELKVIIPGYYERKMGRQLQFDGLFFK